MTPADQCYLENIFPCPVNHSIKMDSKSYVNVLPNALQEL